jgi:(p)ppGpp synthase/HD superfamily hydrolase
MIYTQKIQGAINLSIEVHQLTGEPQFRKGKAIPYVTHPLTVALILSQAGAPEDVVVAGVLHDTIEDCVPHGTITKEMLADTFGEKVAELVDSVSEKNKKEDWRARKEAALEEIKQFSHNSLMLKSADVISNNTELIADYERDGEKTFERFNAPKEQSIGHTVEVIDVIVGAWPENPLIPDLQRIASTLKKIS